MSDDSRSREPLSRDRIAEAALDLFDTAGTEGFSLRNLAKGMGVRAPSLYSHVEGIGEVLDLVHALVNSEIDTTWLLHEDWRLGFRRFAYSYRKAYRQHPAAATAIISGKGNEESALSIYTLICAKLRDIGVPHASVMPLMAHLDYLVLGSTVAQFAADFPSVPRLRSAGYYELADALGGLRRSAIDDKGFEVGLSSWLDLVESLARAC